MSDIEITAAVPVPVSAKARKYPWPTMKDGDSFVVQGPRARKSALTSFDFYKRSREAAGGIYPFKLVTRSVGGGQYRLWLIHSE